MALLLGACAASPWKDFYGDARSATIPGDIRAFVIDAQGCGHFSGEEPYDVERAAFLKKNIDAMCTELEKRHRKLAAQHAGNPEATAMIAEAWGVFK